MKVIYNMLSGMVLLALLLGISVSATANVRGIYVTQTTAENTKLLTSLINKAKAADINTFVIDYGRANKHYTDNMALVKENGIRYVARIVVFPGGGTPEQLASIEYREKKLNLIKQAIALGAQAIQLDYIRFASKNKASPENAEKVNLVIKWFHDKLQPYGVPLQIDVFGITSFHQEFRIGQYPKVFASSVDGICPMDYPSHFADYKIKSAQPYKTVNSSVIALKEQLKDEKPVKVYAYIEAYNYRYHMASSQRATYIAAEMKGAEDAGADGWYVWSANNVYDHVFEAIKLRQRQPKQALEDNSLNQIKEVNS
jgi:hypothetical protein